MNPCPAGLEIHPDLAGYRVFPIVLGSTANLNEAGDAAQS
jgi:hypothetical protein